MCQQSQLTMHHPMMWLLHFLKKKLKIMGGLVIDGQYFHVRCCAHIFNLVFNDRLRDAHNSITTIRNVVGFVRSSPYRLARFKECIKFSKIECKQLVCLNVWTRWNFTYLMLGVVEKFQVSFEKLDDSKSSYIDFFRDVDPPVAKDWMNVRAFIQFLKFFYESTRVFSTSLNVSLCVVFHQLTTICTFCTWQGSFESDILFWPLWGVPWGKIIISIRVM